MKKYVFTLMCAAAALLAACDQPAGEETGSGIIVTGGTTLAVAADQTTTTLAFSAEAAWTAAIESGAEWLLEVTPASGEAGDQTLTLNFTANETEAVRTATVRLASGEDAVTVTVTQQGKENEGGEDQPTGGAMVKELFLSESNRMLFTTDAQGRVTRCEQRISRGEEYFSYFDEFVYGENQMVWTSYRSDNGDKTVSTCAMEDGRLMTIDEQDGDRCYYTYNADGTMASFGTVDANNQPVENYAFAWTDGNLTSIYEAYTGFEWTIEYGEETSGIVNIDPEFFLLGDLDGELSRFLLTGKASRTLPTSCTVKFSDEEGDTLTYSYDYEFGSNQAISKIHLAAAVGYDESGDQMVIELKY